MRCNKRELAQRVRAQTDRSMPPPAPKPPAPKLPPASTPDAAAEPEGAEATVQATSGGHSQPSRKRARPQGVYVAGGSRAAGASGGLALTLTLAIG